ncbi:MAG: UDP-N-acetylmuramoyl-tripeptide--D-alanyl-D-alanine ligase [Vicinamibacterales bacterium]
MITARPPIVLTAQLVADVTGGRLASGRADQVFAGVAIDSRQPLDGKLFVALRGDRFDGHEFVSQAVAQGAVGVLVMEAAAETRGVAAIAVADTLAALHALAHYVRVESGSVVIAITGSAGKTTTKEVTAELLSTRYRVFRNRGNFNNHIGLPLSLMELTDCPDLAVVELGMNHRGEIRALTAIATPDVRVWTNVGDAHIGHLGSREAVAAAKAEILEGSGAETLVVANADDPLVMAHIASFGGRLRTFGESPSADVRAHDVVDRGFDGTTASVTTRTGICHLRVPLAGRAHLFNVLAAMTVALEFGIPLSTIEERVALLRPVARRGASLTLRGGARLVDDSYNASPAAVLAALQALAATPADGRRIAVIGEMLELGSMSRALHEECGRTAARLAIDVLMTIGGGDADALGAAAVAAGMPTARVYRFADSHLAAEQTTSLVGPGDLVLVKGSRGTRTDIVSDRLLEVA